MGAARLPREPRLELRQRPPARRRRRLPRPLGRERDRPWRAVPRSASTTARRARRSSIYDLDGQRRLRRPAGAAAHGAARARASSSIPTTTCGTRSSPRAAQALAQFAGDPARDRRRRPLHDPLLQGVPARPTARSLEPVMSWMDTRAYQPYVPDDPDGRLRDDLLRLHHPPLHRASSATRPPTTSSLQWPIDTDTWQWSTIPRCSSSSTCAASMLFELQLPGDDRRPRDGRGRRGHRHPGGPARS